MTNDISKKNITLDEISGEKNFYIIPMSLNHGQKIENSIVTIFFRFFTWRKDILITSINPGL